MKGQAVSGYERLGVWETIKTFRICTMVCFSMAFSAATDGYQVGIIANKGEPALASPILASWSSIMSCGQIVGMTTLPFLSSRYGRKKPMYTFWMILVSSVLAESLAKPWQAWLVDKLLAGIGVGCLQSTVPTYIAEVAPNRIRGSLLIYTQWARIGLMILIYLVVPESPAWCIGAGKTERARKELLRLYRGVPGFNMEQQLQDLSLLEKWYTIFRGTDGLRTIITLWTNTTQQFIGLTLFSTFGTYFFQQAGLSDSFKIKVITASIQIGTVLVLVTIIDRLGRRYLACGGTTISWAACLAIGIIGVVPKGNPSTYVFVFLPTFRVNVGLAANGATGWGYIGEISSQLLRPYTPGFCRSAAELDELFKRKAKPRRFHKKQTVTQRFINMKGLEES
ncbi:major facilitator superfamily domain-containing protein [Aspergillus alliaceus]|uniref:Major facilitator superfamily domain-containing protein n=1 Tax=Petromyces alliaceus TaxID=209559 RepID=A0A5N7CMX8_PETAA|nr:major facilitator superfamily domain-containing protein [Aspergillus alliaceus]